MVFMGLDRPDESNDPTQINVIELDFLRVRIQPNPIKP